MSIIIVSPSSFLVLVREILNVENELAASRTGAVGFVFLLRSHAAWQMNSFRPRRVKRARLEIYKRKRALARDLFKFKRAPAESLTRSVRLALLIVFGAATLAMLTRPTGPAESKLHARRTGSPFGAGDFQRTANRPALILNPCALSAAAHKCTITGL